MHETGDPGWQNLLEKVKQATIEREFIWPTVEQVLKELLPGTEVHVDTGGDSEEQCVDGSLGGFYCREVRFRLQWHQDRLWWSVWEIGADDESRTPIKEESEDIQMRALEALPTLLEKCFDEAESKAKKIDELSKLIADQLRLVDPN